MTNPQEALQVIETLRTRNLANISLEELVILYPKIKEFCTHVWEARRGVESLIADRLEAQKATTCSVNGTTLTLVVTKEREYSEKLETELLPHLSQEQLEKVVDYIPRWKWRGLKSLIPLGGIIRERILANVMETTTRISIKIERAPLPAGATAQPLVAVTSNGHTGNGLVGKSVVSNGV